LGGRNGGGPIAQNVYFTEYSAAINSRAAVVTAGFWEASLDQGADTDTAQMRVSVFDASNNIIGQFTSPAVVFENASNPVPTVYGSYEAHIQVPKFTVAANFEIAFIHNSGPGSDQDAYVDQTYLSINAIPEPAAVLLAGFGALFTLNASIRKRRYRITWPCHANNLHNSNALLMQSHDLLAPLVKLLKCLLSSAFYVHEYRTQNTINSSDFFGPKQ
jgi:hypothetical protein